MSKRKILAVAAAAAVILCATAGLAVRWILGGQNGSDLIRGTFSATADGKELAVGEGRWTGENGEGERFRLRDGAFSAAGGTYGVYDFIFVLDNRALADLTGDDVFLALPEQTQLVYQYVSPSRQNRSDLALHADLVRNGGQWLLKMSADYEQSGDGGRVTDYAETSMDYLDCAYSIEIRMSFGV